MKTLFEKRDKALVLGKYYNYVQSRWADKMNDLTVGMSKRKLICLLILFALLSASYFLFNIYRSISNHGYSLVNTTTISKIKTINFKK